MNQLPLSIHLNEQATFADFGWGNNHLLKEELLRSLQGEGERIFYLWSLPGCGKSHLLQACCQEIFPRRHYSYLPLNNLIDFEPTILEDLALQDLIAIDDIGAIAGKLEWEEALFHLYNQIRDNEKTILIVSAHEPPAFSPLQLPDLRSRLFWGLIAQLQELSDDDKQFILAQRARKRGFNLPIPVLQFLLHRCQRNMHTLFDILDRLDDASLAEKRKITLPFVKRILGG